MSGEQHTERHSPDKVCDGCEPPLTEGRAMTISDEAIKAAARALYAHFQSEAEEAGATLVSYPVDEYECCAEEAIKAAAPFIRAEALLDAANADRACPTCGAKEGKPCYGNGPMRTPHQSRGISRDWLRARAAAERGWEWQEPTRGPGRTEGGGRS